MSEGLDKAISFFEKMGPTILDMEFNVNGAMHSSKFFEELVPDEGMLSNPDDIRKRLHKIPALLVFYGILKDTAEKEFNSLQEQFDVWYSEASCTVNQKEVFRLNSMTDPNTGKIISASLKKAPTLDQLKGLVMREYPSDWAKWKQSLENYESRLKTLTRMVDGLRIAAKAAESSTNLLVALVYKGIEDVKPVPKTFENLV